MEIGVVPLTRLLNQKFSPEAVREAAALTRILLPVQWCLMIGGLMMGTLYARKRFLVPGVGPIVYNVGQIAGALFFGGRYGLAAVAWGALIGAALGNVLLPLWEMRRVGVRWRLGFDLRHPGVVKMGRLMIPVLLGQSLSQLNMWLTGRFLPEDARRAALTYAYNLTQAPIGIFAQAFGIVLLPTISLLAAQKDWGGYRQTVSDGLRRVFFLTIPASAIMAALAAPIISLFLKQGKFTAQDVPMAATALVCYSIATFAWSGSSILARGFYAVQDTKTPVLVTTPMVAVFVLLAWAYTAIDPSGYVGLALSTSLVGVISMFALLFLLQKKVGGLNLRGIASSTLRITAASLAAGGVAYALASALGRVLPDGKVGSLVTVLAAGSAAVAVYGGLCYALRVPELRTIKEMFRKPRRAGADGPPAE
jgi:putative peptidoglycan lipid II flippase